MKIAYPVILDVDEDDSGWINVTVPDIFGGVTCGEGEENSISMAKDLISLMLKEAPAQCLKPKSLEETKRNFPNSKVVLVEVEI